MEFTRRDAVGLLAAAAAATLEQSAEAQSAPPLTWPVTIGWLGGSPPPLPTGVSWGVPWPRGAVRREQTFSLAAAGGRALPLQSWTLAYWPDDSVKWTAFATVADAASSGALSLALGAAAPPAPPLRVTPGDAAVEIDTGRLRCAIPTQGAALIGAMTIDGRVVARQGRLLCTLENRSELDTRRTLRFEDFTGDTRNVTVEQSGPLRAVVKVEGVHRSATASRQWLPFVVRLYFYAGLETVRLVHTIVFDGDQETDFIRGLGLAFTVPMREQVHNRHVRFSTGGDGLWSEPVLPLTGRRVLAAPAGAGAIYAAQLAGQRIPNQESFNPAGQKLISDWARWDDYQLAQLTPDGFAIHKRANAQSCWLEASAGRRASGLVFAGDVSGGLAVGVKNFWQSYPASLEVRGAAGASAELRAWLWSPDAAAMDLRHYDTRAHGLDSSYEDVQPGFSTAHGIARTSELTLFPGPGVPSREESVRQAHAAQEPPLLVATPQHLHSARAFGVWSLPDRSTPARRALEDQLDAPLEIYRKEVDQRRWYGFWNYGDVMHQHDGPRHQWRYDVGGYAWDNTELGTDLWLWYSFLRTGRADVFRMAEAMTRHTSEVDVYHLGRFAMLGSRHNVRHWGCGAKEVRISQAAYKRFYHYLTTDERTGDLMREVVDADRTFLTLDPMRLAAPLTAPIPYPCRARGGPDWLACVGNWMTEWERTGDTRWRDKIIAGMESIAQMPFGFLTGPDQLYGYDPENGKLYALERRVGPYNLATIMGGAEVVFELNPLVDHAGWNRVWDQFCRLHTAPEAVIARDNATGNEGADGQYARPGRLSAYLYSRTRNPAFARRAWAAVSGGRYGVTRVQGPDVPEPVDEVTGLSTNSVAQGSLELIQVLEMCGDQLPA
jgi:hypothetical protein